MVEKGYSQCPWEDFESTYFPLVKSSLIIILSAIAAKMNLKINQVDVVTVYLNGELRHSIFMKIPDNLMDVLQKLNYVASLGSSVSKSLNARETALKWLQEIQK